MKRVQIASLKQVIFWIVTIGLSLLIPCSPAFATQGRHPGPMIKVMTRNLYLGADIFRVVEAALNPNPDPDGLDVPRAVADVFRIMQETDFAERAEAIADEILHTSPDVIGIQEASTYYLQTPSDFLAGNTVQASAVFIDFYAVLDAALQKRGLFYDAYSVTNADIEMPMVDQFSDTGLSDVRLVDRDMILVRRGLPSSLTANDNYLNNLSLDILGQPVQFTRGFVIVDVKIKGQEFRIVNTHLEIRSDPGSVFRVVQDIQMQELLTIVGMLSIEEPRQVIMVGDFNSSPDDRPGISIDADFGPLFYLPPYMRAKFFGYLDAWLQQEQYDQGYTSGFDESLRDSTAELTTRIDHIFLGRGRSRIENVNAQVVGDEFEDRTPGGLWPSDHGGVVAEIEYAPRFIHPFKIRKK